MNILIPIDIEDEVRKALVPYFANVVAGDLPPNLHKKTDALRGEGAHKC